MLLAKKIKTHSLLLSTIVEMNELRTYSYFLRFKSLFNSSALNKGNRAKLSRLTGLSDKTCRVYVGKMKRLGWIKQNGSDYVFISYKEMFIKYKLNKKQFNYHKIINVSSDDSTDLLITKLASILLEANIDRQISTIAVRAEIHKPTHSQSSVGRLATKYKNKGWNYKYSTNVSARFNDVVLSCKGFGGLIGRGRTAGKLLKKKLVEMECITVETNQVLLRDFKGRYDLYLLMKARSKTPERMFWYSGKAWNREPDFIASFNYIA